ncbi:MAG TPA: 3-dehydroquinate synthase [Acidobacteriota bacterium]|nr:3-dehydroquinate synthase [Acidobacteriota bacterium]
MVRAPQIRPTFRVRTAPRDVRVYAGDHLLDRLGQVLRPARSGLPVELVTDRTAAGLFAVRTETTLRRVGWRVRRFVLPPGESVKSSATIAKLHERWFDAGYDRHTPIVALGGGTITDAVGFAAATFMRGLPLWFVPTTIVGQVDAAIGGKVGINHRRGKNLIGAFYHPDGIIIDSSLLATLTPRDRRAGLAEVLKYGVIADAALFHTCEESLPAWVEGTRALDARTIRRCVRIKLDVVAVDETDRGQRHILNFGHTLGHAFERWGGFRRLRHGEAVALGMVGAASIARHRGLLRPTAFNRLADACAVLRPPRRLPEFAADDILAHLAFDKKRRAGRNLWVLPRGIGRVVIRDDITQREARAAVAFVRDWLATDSGTLPSRTRRSI